MRCINDCVAELNPTIRSRLVRGKNASRKEERHLTHSDVCVQAGIWNYGESLVTPRAYMPKHWLGEVHDELTTARKTYTPDLDSKTLSCQQERDPSNFAPITPSCHALRLNGTAHITECAQELPTHVQTATDIGGPNGTSAFPPTTGGAGVGGHDLSPHSGDQWTFCDGFQAWRGAKKGLPAFRTQRCQSGIKTRCGTLCGVQDSEAVGDKQGAPEFNVTGFMDVWRQESPVQRFQYEPWTSSTLVFRRLHLSANPPRLTRGITFEPEIDSALCNHKPLVKKSARCSGFHVDVARLCRFHR
jgi:hypothetical protein